MYKFSDMVYELMLSMHAQQKEYEDSQFPSTIIETVSKALSVKKVDVISPSRKREHVDARHIISFILVNHSSLSSREVGEMLGGRDHSTALMSAKAYQEAIDSKDKKFLAKVELVKAELKEGLCI